MQTKASPLLPIFRSRSLTALLTYLFVNEPPMTTLSALAGAIGVAPSTVKREIDELETAGIVRTVRVGRNRFVGVNTLSPVYVELRALILKAFGPAAVIRDELSPVPGIDEAFVFGSWARRHGGERGPIPRDVDVLIVGDPEPDDVFRACETAQERLGIDVNATIVTAEEWNAGESPFLHAVRQEALVPVGRE